MPALHSSITPVAHALPIMPSVADIRIADGPTGCIITYFDDAAGAIRIEPTGLWTTQQVDMHCGQLRALVDAMRTRSPHVLVFVDRRGADVQSPEVARRLGQGMATMYRPGDRIAVLLSSSLVKMQIRQVLDMSLHELFVSEKAAFLWLRAYD